MKIRKRRHCGGSKLWLYFTGIILITIIVVFLVLSIGWITLYHFGIINTPMELRHAPILAFVLCSIILGTSITLFVGRFIIKPVQSFVDAFDELSNGNLSVKVPADARLHEIRRMAQHFNAMTYDLSHIETLRSDFVANVSHEFKTPLSAIEGYATLLQNPKLTPEKHDYYVTKILDNAGRLSTLSTNILALSKLENQELVTDETEFRLDEQIRKSILLLERKWTVKNIEFDMELPRQMYYGSEALLSQVWYNIIDNAIKHSPEGSVIHVAITKSAGFIEVSVTDHGDGMSDEVQKHIFEKFYQGDSSHKSEGNGLGLALVHRIVELCHGHISVSSLDGCGACFKVSLPQTEADE